MGSIIAIFMTRANISIINKIDKHVALEFTHMIYIYRLLISFPSIEQLATTPNTILLMSNYWCKEHDIFNIRGSHLRSILKVNCWFGLYHFVRITSRRRETIVMWYFYTLGVSTRERNLFMHILKDRYMYLRLGIVPFSCIYLFTPMSYYKTHRNRQNMSLSW